MDIKDSNNLSEKELTKPSNKINEGNLFKVSGGSGIGSSTTTIEREESRTVTVDETIIDESTTITTGNIAGEVAVGSKIRSGNRTTINARISRDSSPEAIAFAQWFMSSKSDT